MFIHAHDLSMADKVVQQADLEAVQNKLNYQARKGLFFVGWLNCISEQELIVAMKPWWNFYQKATTNFSLALERPSVFLLLFSVVPAAVFDVR